MTLHALQAGSAALMRSAQTLTMANVTGRAPGAASALRAGAADGMRTGADAVRGMGGPFFARMADDIAGQAAVVQRGGPVTPAIAAAMDGASHLMRRIALVG